MEMKPESSPDWKLLDASRLELGDVLLESGCDKSAAAVAKATRGRFSHALMYIGGGDVIEAMPSGVRNLQCARIGISEPNNWQLLRVETKNQIYAHQAASVARKHCFKVYDTKGALRTQFAPRQLPSFDRLFCSQLVALAYNEAGLPLFPNGNASAVTPNDLFRCELLEKIDVPLKDAPREFQKFFDWYGGDRSKAYDESIPGKEQAIATQIFNAVREDVLRLEWPRGKRPGNLPELLDLLLLIRREAANPICSTLLDLMKETDYFELYKPAMAEAFIQAHFSDLSSQLDSYRLSLDRHRGNAAACKQRFLTTGHEIWRELAQLYETMASGFELLIATVSKRNE
jgi:uncharacterized protein YycO